MHQHGDAKRISLGLILVTRLAGAEGTNLTNGNNKKAGNQESTHLRTPEYVSSSGLIVRGAPAWRYLDKSSHRESGRNFADCHFYLPCLGDFICRHPVMGFVLESDASEGRFDFGQVASLSADRCSTRGTTHGQLSDGNAMKLSTCYLCRVSHAGKRPVNSSGNRAAAVAKTQGSLSNAVL